VGSLPQAHGSLLRAGGTLRPANTSNLTLCIEAEEKIIHDQESAYTAKNIKNSSIERSERATEASIAVEAETSYRAHWSSITGTTQVTYRAQEAPTAASMGPHIPETEVISPTNQVRFDADRHRPNDSTQSCTAPYKGGEQHNEENSSTAHFTQPMEEANHDPPYSALSKSLAAFMDDPGSEYEEPEYEYGENSDTYAPSEEDTIEGAAHTWSAPQPGTAEHALCEAAATNQRTQPPLVEPHPLECPPV